MPKPERREIYSLLLCTRSLTHNCLCRPHAARVHQWGSRSPPSRWYVSTQSTKAQSHNAQDDLRRFHATHFSNAPLPEHQPDSTNEQVQEEYYDEDDDGLGYYEDGVKRTLTDEQIAMFRHSEIQRILRERRRAQEDGQSVHDDPTPDVDMEDGEVDPVGSAISGSGQSTPMSISSDDEQGQAAPAEKPQQKWTATSEKTRARNARNRKKNRKNHRERKKVERKKLEQEQKDARLRAEREEMLGEESDEWDPWHQANGPDAQKEDAVDLDY